MTGDEKREREIREILVDIERRWRAEAEPYIKELTEIVCRKPPPPFTLPDGRTFVFTPPAKLEK